MNLEYWISQTFSLLNWLFLHTIYGMLGVAILVYLLFRDLRKTFPRFPEPALAAGLVFLLGVVTLPSIPRLQFHNEMLKLMLRTENSGSVASTSSWRSMTEPLTWVNPPIGAVTVIWPQTLRQTGGPQTPTLTLFENRFYEWTTRYGEKPAESLVDADCVQSTIRYTRPDESGILRPVTPSPVKMIAREKDWYCEHDWSREHAWSWEKEALLRTCGKACQVLAIEYTRRDEEPSDPVSTRAADQAFGAKKCADKEMTPVQIMRKWWSRGSKYSTRHWMVLCARPH